MINNKIENYLKAGETYINSPYVKKQMKELNIKPEEIWDKDKEYSKGKEEGDKLLNLTKEYNRLYSEKDKREGGFGARRMFDPGTYNRRTYEENVENIQKGINRMKEENKKIKLNDIDAKLKKFRKQYNY